MSLRLDKFFLNAAFFSKNVTVDTGRRFFPNCSDILDKMLNPLTLESGTPEEQRSKKMRYEQLKDDFEKAFNKDKAENHWAGFKTSSTTSSPKSNKRKK